MFKRVIPVILITLLFLFSLTAIRAMKPDTITQFTDTDEISRFGRSMRNLLASLQSEVDQRVEYALEQGKEPEPLVTP